MNDILPMLSIGLVILAGVVLLLHRLSMDIRALTAAVTAVGKQLKSQSDKAEKPRIMRHYTARWAQEEDPDE